MQPRVLGSSLLKWVKLAISSPIENDFVPLLCHASSNSGPFRVGWVHSSRVETLLKYNTVFHQINHKDGGSATPTAIAVKTLSSAAERTTAVSEAVRDLAAKKLITGWRNETYRVVPGLEFFTEPLFLIERGAAPYFGIRTFGVHLNGYVCSSSNSAPTHMWIAKRSMKKSREPGKLDNIVAGGIPICQTPTQTLVREAQEEASIPESLVASARATGFVAYEAMWKDESQLKAGMQFVYDIHLPKDFIPSCADGEVESFHLWPLSRVIETLNDTTTQHFKFNVNLILIDFLVRHGFYQPEEPFFVEVLRLLSQLRARGPS